MKFYCMKCKKQVEVADVTPKSYGNRKVMTGVHTCGCKVTKFVSKSD